MSRGKIGFYLVLDMVFIGAVGYKLWLRAQELNAQKAPAVSPTPAAVSLEVPVVPNPAEVPTETVQEPPTPAPAEVPPVVSTPEPAPPVKPPVAIKPPTPRVIKRKIMFRFFSPSAINVGIVGSFNDWKPSPMRKSAGNVWVAVVELLPGDYSYNFWVDGKFIRDPSNPRTDEQGRSLKTVSKEP